MAKKKPDQVADNPNILPYASNVGAPVIKPTDLTSFKQEKILKIMLTSLQKEVMQVTRQWLT